MNSKKSRLASGGSHEFSKGTSRRGRVHFVLRRQQLEAKALTVAPDRTTDRLLAMLVFSDQNFALVALRHELSTNGKSDKTPRVLRSDVQQFHRRLTRLINKGTKFVVVNSTDAQEGVWWEKQSSSNI